MKKRLVLPLTALVWCVAATVAAPMAHAQHVSRSMETRAYEEVRVFPATGNMLPATADVSPWRPLRIAKWAAAAGSAGAALYGFSVSRRAEAGHTRLEEACQAEPDVCRERLPGGAYADAELEAMYQDVRALDRRARASLLLGQVGVATTVLLFLLDLRNDRPPPNIPWEPARIQLAPGAGGGVSLILRVPPLHAAGR